MYAVRIRYPIAAEAISGSQSQYQTITSAFFFFTTSICILSLRDGDPILTSVSDVKVDPRPERINNKAEFVTSQHKILYVQFFQLKRLFSRFARQIAVRKLHYL